MANDIIIAFIVVSSVGLLAGILLAIVSHLFKSNVDERVAEIRECLPGVNCGACGYRGCDDYASAVADGSAEPNLCIPGAESVASDIAAILGVEVKKVNKMTALAHCHGNCEATEPKAIYSGIKTCKAAAMIYGGPNSCAYGCLGFGDCAEVCPSGLICIKDGIAHIDAKECLGCGLCAKACPKHIITLVPKTSATVVMCSSKDKGADARKLCKNACIGCKKCEKNCEAGAVTVVDNLARINRDKCTNCGKCAEVCPTQCIREFIL